MAEIDLVSSHTPWTPLPHMVAPDSWVTARSSTSMLANAPSKSALWRDPAKVRAAYGQSIQYSLNAITAFVQASHDKNLVVVMYGDHQPAAIVSGRGANHVVPDHRHRPRPRGARPDLQLGLAGRHATRAGRAPLADERLPRPLLHGLRPAALRRLAVSR